MLEDAPCIVNALRLADEVTHLLDEIFNDRFRVCEGEKRNFNDRITRDEPFTVFRAVTANQQNTEKLYDLFHELDVFTALDLLSYAG